MNWRLTERLKTVGTGAPTRGGPRIDSRARGGGPSTLHLEYTVPNVAQVHPSQQWATADRAECFSKRKQVFYVVLILYIADMFASKTAH
jgi:hypothetical protein